jgi:PAS domain S-box-containing protein
MERVPGSVRVLHVDDDPDFVDMAATFLEREDDDFAVETATCAEAALDRLGADRFDCIVSDHDMPERNGLEFLEAVRADHGDLPFILFTGKGSEELASEAISAGVSDYLQKGRGTEQYAILANRIRNLVDQRRAERAADRTETLLSELAANSDDVFWSYTADWSELLFISDSYAAIWGQSVERLRADPTAFIEATHPADRDRALAAMERVSAGETIDLEFRVNPDESYGRWVWVRGTPILEDGEVVRLAGFARDVTERRRREQALEELHTVAAELPELDSREAICQRTVEAASNILAFDLCIINLATDGVLAPMATSGDLSPEDIRPMSFDEALAGLTYRTGETQLVDDLEAHREANPQGAFRSGLSIPLGDHGVFQATNGALAAFDDTDRDLAELLVAHATRALDQLAHEGELERYETIVGALGDPVYTTDEEGRYTYVNDAFVELTGHDREEILGEEAPFLLTEASAERALDCIRELLSGDARHQQTYDITVETADGERVSCEDNLALLPLEDGEYRGAAGVVRDVTDRVERERELERQNDRLEEFTSVVSHDLRNPLNVAQGRLDRARQAFDSAELDAANDALDRMDELVEDLLTLARQGTVATAPEPVPLVDAVETAWRHVETTGATLAVETDAVVLADRSRLTEFLENLIRNAVEHGPTGDQPAAGDAVEHGSTGLDPEARQGAAEHGSTSPTARQDGVVADRMADDPTTGSAALTVTVGDLADGFYVADDGAGVPDDAADRVFEAGFSTEDEGTGFGLNIVSNIAEAHGWTVDVTESAGGGARFEVTGAGLLAD